VEGVSEIAPIGHSAMHLPQKEQHSGILTQATLRLPILSRVISLELQAATHLPHPEHLEVSTIMDLFPFFIGGRLILVPFEPMANADLWVAGHSLGRMRSMHDMAACIASGMIRREGLFQQALFSS